MIPLPDHPVRITVHFARREDGGLRVWSDDVPGLVLSHSDPKKVVADVIPALEAILSQLHGEPVKVFQLAESIPTEREYAAFAA